MKQSPRNTSCIVTRTSLQVTRTSKVGRLVVSKMGIYFLDADAVGRRNAPHFNRSVFLVSPVMLVPCLFRLWLRGH